MSEDVKPAFVQHLSTNLFGGLDKEKESQSCTKIIIYEPTFLTLADCKRPPNALRARSSD